MLNPNAELVRFEKPPKRESYECGCGYKQFNWAAFLKHQSKCPHK